MRLKRGIALACLPLLLAATTDAPPTANWPRPALDAPKGVDQRLLDIGLSDLGAVAVGEQGLILHSADGGAWQQAASPVDAMLTRVRFLDAQRGFALGHDAVILETVDGGSQWSLRHHDTTARALHDLIVLGPRHLLAVGGYGTMLESRDDGRSWHALDNALVDLGMHLNRVLRTRSGTLLVVGERGLAARSANNGASWEVLDFPYAGSLFGAVVQGERVWVHGMRGRVYTTDALERCATTPADTWDPYERTTQAQPELVAATGWRELATPTQESLFGAVFVDRALLLLGVNGVALQLPLAGGAIEVLGNTADETLNAGVAWNGHVWAVGRRGLARLAPAP